LLMSSKSWQPNGDKCPVTNVVNGNGTTVGYKNDGTVKIRTTFKNGKKVVLASSESTNHILKISTTGNVDKLIICDKGKTPNVFHEFDFLMEGWSKEILFQESFRCYSSSIENIVFSVDDGPLKKVGGGKIGRGTFNWKRE
jgi:antitoxin component YwqK of YwqJK toxin-antitoxin module